MRKKGNKRKGATIAELCVVLAVISVISAMVVSFTVMISDKTKDSRKNVEVSNDLDRICTAFENFVEYYNSEDSVWSVDGDSLKVTMDGETYEATFDGEKKEFYARIGDGEPMRVYTTRVKTVEFDLLQKDGKSVFFCRVTYYAPTSGKSEEECVRVFARCPRSGTVVSDGTEVAP